MTTIAQKREQLKKAGAEIAAQALHEFDTQVAERPVDDGKLKLRNAAGEMLKCKLTLAKREHAPDPLCITIGEEYYWLKRGKEAIVPWYLVLHLKNNVETKYHQEKDEKGRNIVVSERMPAEAFSYTPIDPHPENPDWLERAVV